jgi:CTP:molybdopterin cytidylyltransferase MocA
MYTVIIMAVSSAHSATWPSAGRGPDPALQHLNVMAALEIVRALGMSAVFVTDAAHEPPSGPLAPPWPKATSITLLATGRVANLASSLIAGIEASPHADGWLIMPAHLPAPPLETFRRIGEALAQHPIAYPIFQNERGTPIGFGKELFSELMHLSNNHDLLRLMSRYPCRTIEVDAPLTPAEEWIYGPRYAYLSGPSPTPH